MQFRVLCFGVLIGDLLAVMPTNISAHSVQSFNPLPCQVASNPASSTYCRPLADMILPSGVTVVISDGSSVLVDSVRVAGTFGLDGSTLRVAGGEFVTAQSSQDVGTTGSIKAAEAQDDVPASPDPHADAQMSPSDAASPLAAPNASASETASAPDASSSNTASPPGAAAST